MHKPSIPSALLVLSLKLFAEASTGPERSPRLDETSETTSYHANAGNLKYVNPFIGTQGGDPNDNGGMIPSVAPPFAMTRWTPQTRENYISQVPYSNWDDRIHGFQATHQPAIWMGENGHVTLMPGLGDEIQPLFQKRGLAFKKSDESSTAYVYEVKLDATNSGSTGGNQSSIKVSMSASAHVGHLRIDFDNENKQQPSVFIQASRLNWTGHIDIDEARHEISGSNPQRHDYNLGPDRPKSFNMFFVSRFSVPFESYGVTQGGKVIEGKTTINGKFVGGYVKFNKSVQRVEVRTGVSYISVAQARRNLDTEIPDGSSFDTTVQNAKAAWLDKLGRITVTGVNKTDSEHDQRTVFYTALFHALQYPSDFSEPTTSASGGTRLFYSGYTDSVHAEQDSYYQSWSIWDTYRAEHSLLALLAPERVDSMMRTLLRIFDWTGRLPLWANLVETNIMIATNADVILANALIRGFQGFNVTNAWKAVQTDAYKPPENDTELLYYDREPFTPREARAGLTSYLEHGWVDNDHWSEAASRTLDYSLNDYACAVVAAHSGNNESSKELMARSKNYAKLWNSETEFMQTRNNNGTFALDSWGWTEGDKWVYTFDVMHDVNGLAALFKNGKKGMKSKLDAHFGGGHNMQSNEPSHHVPYLYSAIGYASSTAEQVRSIAWDNYNATASGLSGNEDLGQMSAWYIFSALGFYPVNPASDEYIVGTPFFDEVRIVLPKGPLGGGQALVISAPGAGTEGKSYVKSLKVDGKSIRRPVLLHSEIVKARRIEFKMSNQPTSWGSKIELS
ncbi:glycoside hydrolase family 92 protein [Trichoderma atroviride IMI 206040]|uniref:Glycoside hydrolase family 92 protein n=1 Tax=Hypocrea atroviridis (strain ATCC 20476 / IMI 206040) TaxID=452589 RepID=G9NFV5_HYPAI|nr:glycoside hydrolase family 92 protein [Trichoderma atroviride IMI 206040]EHK50168.1 glycoside hydrolase family 92 protein [Trichoderma atroviride IMI 206040]